MIDKIIQLMEIMFTSPLLPRRGTRGTPSDSREGFAVFSTLSKTTI